VDQDGNGPGNMVDADEWTHSGDIFGVPSDYSQLCNTNTCPGTDLGVITKVEMEGKIDVYGAEGFFYLTPVFTGGNGTTRLFQEVYAPNGGLTGWFDITSDPHAPTTWTWADVQNVDVWVRGRHTVAYHDESAYKFWIRVTYTIENVDTYASNYSTLKDEFYLPSETVYAKAMGLTLGEAWLPGWHKRMRMTINQSDVSSDLTDFPVLIHLSASSGQGLEDVTFVFTELGSDANRKKIAVTTGDGKAECYVEIEKWDTANKQAWLWVKVPSVSSTTGTVLYLYYDSSHADNTDHVGDPGSAPAKVVWGDHTSYVIDYGGVWHLDEAASDGTPGGQKDSSPNGNHGTPKNFQDGGGGATGTTGKIDGADKFAGDDDYVTVSSPSNTDPSNYLTVSAWIKISALSHNGDIVSRGDSYGLRVWGNGQILFFKYVGSNQWYNMAPSGVNVIDNTFHYIVGVQSGTGMNLYIDGVQKDSNGNTTAIVYGLGSTLEIGRHGNGSPDYNFTGTIDEVRVQNIARDASWIKASYENERDHLIDYGGEETTGAAVPNWLNNWKKRMKMTIDHTEISSSLANFPVLIYLSSSSGIYRDSVVGVFNEVGSSSKKIAVTTSDGTTQCYVEIEKWDSANSKAWLWVNVSSVSSTADTILYLYYDSSHADNTNYVGDPTSTPAKRVWDSYFKGVFHLGETSGGSGAIKNSTSTSNGGTDSGSPTFGATGEVDGAINFDGTNDYINLGKAFQTITTAITIEGWMKPDVVADQKYWFSVGLNSPAFKGVVVGTVGTSGKISCETGDGSAMNNLLSSGTYSTTSLIYVVVTWDGTTKKIFLNGAYDNSKFFSGPIKYDTTQISLIGMGWTSGGYFDGIVDEVRVSNAARTSD